ncbi:MAG: hypothetical protein M0Z30_23980 [Actinomycetota bacterium]|nr:hypothetical protein [Actinomycetota bacterium]
MLAHREADESGITLILVMVLLLGVCVLLVSLIGISSDDILNSQNVLSQRTNEYALDAAATTALQLVRFDPADCTGGPQTIQIASNPAHIECSPGTSPTGQRQAVISVCVVNPCSAALADLTVTASFTDGPECPPGSGQAAECGESIQIESWTLRGKD